MKKIFLFVLILVIRAHESQISSLRTISKLNEETLVSELSQTFRLERHSRLISDRETFKLYLYYNAVVTSHFKRL